MLDWDDRSTWRVLLVDDEPDNVEVVAETLRFFGVAVKTAANGEAGMQTLDTFIPNLFLLDLSMPKMDGWQMRTLIKADPRTQDVPVIALSAHAMAGDKERAFQAGFDGYLTKPVNIPSLVKDLRSAIEEKQLWQKCQETPECQEKTEPEKTAVQDPTVIVSADASVTD